MSEREWLVLFLGFLIGSCITVIIKRIRNSRKVGYLHVTRLEDQNQVRFDFEIDD